MGVLLISEIKLKNFTNINKNVDMDVLKAEVQIAQDIEDQYLPVAYGKYEEGYNDGLHKAVKIVRLKEYKMFKFTHISKKPHKISIIYT